MDKTYYSHTGKIYKIYLDSHNFEDRVELDLNNYYISNDGDKVFAIKLPETYEECCVVLGLITEINLSLPLYLLRLTRNVFVRNRIDLIARVL